MNWTWERIERDWLGQGRVAASQGEILAAFESAEDQLGQSWIDAIHASSVGAHSVAVVVAMGRKLKRLEHASGLSGVLQRIQAGHDAARTELTAAYLCVPADMSVEVEFEPEVRIGVRRSVPDFRIRRQDEPWTYVEVSAPDVSELQRRAHAVLEQLGKFIAEMPFGATAEVMLRRDPCDQEVDEIGRTLLRQLRTPGDSRIDLSGLALLLVRYDPLVQVVLDEHGEPATPRIGLMHFVVRGNDRKHLLLRYAFSDQRAAEFLKREARQLPKDSPGLVMVDVSRASGARRAWEPLLRGRLKPYQHTRVSGVALFGGGMCGLPEGEAWMPWTRVIQNPHATIPAPPWLHEQLRSWRAPPGTSSVVDTHPNVQPPETA